MKKKPIILKDCLPDTGITYIRVEGNLSFHFEPTDDSILVIFKENHNPFFLPSEIHHLEIKINLDDSEEYELLNKQLKSYLCQLVSQDLERAIEKYLNSDASYLNLCTVTESISEMISDMAGIVICLYKRESQEGTSQY